MKLDEPLRQLVAGLLASAAFLFFYFPLALVLWAAAALALLVYGGALIAIGRRPPPARRWLADGVSEADLNAALMALREAARRLERADAAAPAPQRGDYAALARLVERIAGHHRRDPTDLKHTRRFVRHDLPRMVETVEGYVDLSRRAAGVEPERLAELGRMIAVYRPALEKIDRACLENDFAALEIETEVLSEQLVRR